VWKHLSFRWKCIKRAYRGSVEIANAWASLLGAGVIWAFLEWLEIKMPLPDTMLGGVALTFGCLSASWFVIFLFRLWLAPGLLYAEAQDNIDALAKPQGVANPYVIITNPIIHHHHYPLSNPSAAANPIKQDVSSTPSAASTSAVKDDKKT